jgi:hypothetical protein
MAGVKITDLPILSTPNGTDLFYIVDTTGNVSCAITLDDLITTLNSLLNYIPLKGNAFTGLGQVTGDIEVDVAGGGLMTLRFVNGDIIGLGVDYGGYSAISFYNTSANQTVYLYNRGGDLYIENVDTGQSTGALIDQILGLNANKQNFSSGVNVTGQFAVGDGNCVYYDNSKVYFDNGLEASYRGYSKLPSYYFIDSVSYLQSGTNPPTEQQVFETQVGDGIVTKTITYVAAGNYKLVYNVGLITSYMPNATSKVKVICSNGNDGDTIINVLVNNPSLSVIEVEIFTRNAQNGSLSNGRLSNTIIDVMWYV